MNLKRKFIVHVTGNTTTEVKSENWKDAFVKYTKEHIVITDINHEIIFPKEQAGIKFRTGGWLNDDLYQPIIGTYYMPGSPGCGMVVLQS